MFPPRVAVSLGGAPTAVVSTCLARVRRVGLVLVGVAVLMAHAGASVSAAQQLPPDEPLFVVESFLAARNVGDAFGATGWCAAMLEMQDIDGQWFMDEPSTRYWLRQLTDKYFLDTMRRPVASGNTVTWTERLTPRTVRSSDPWSKIMSVEVSAVVRDGTIASLSAPYPPLPLRPPPLAVEGGSSDTVSPPTTVAAIAPAKMFLGTAFGLTLTVFLVASGSTWWFRRRRLQSASSPRQLR
jgi:hypothetical protein